MLKKNPADGVIIVKGVYGFGNRIYSLLMALVYSQITGRKIIVDWTDGMYADHGRNAFPLLFTGLESIDDHEKYKDVSIYPKIWKGQIHKSITEMAQELGYGSEYPDAKDQLSADFADAYYRQKALVLFDYVFRPSLFDHSLTAMGQNKMTSDRKTLQALLTENLSTEEGLQREIDRFQEKNFKSKMIGVHIRYTDNLLPDFTKFNKGTSLERILVQLNKLISENPDAGIFVSTDNRKILTDLKNRYNNIVSLDKFYDPKDFRPIHSSNRCPDKIEMAKHALMDMHLLARCSYLVYSSKSSFAKIAVLFSKIDDSKIFDADPQEI